jgi:2-phosphosulfolactate phosphatase
VEIRLESLLGGARRARGTAVVIDVYRAFTTAAIAFSRGAEAIIIVAEMERALDLRSQGAAEIAFGEVDGFMPDGFDFGNSPFELSTADVEGKTLVQRTSAGTVGVEAAAANSDRTFAASLVTAQATSRVIAREAPAEVTVVAMGDGGKFRTDEDEQCALYIRGLLQGMTPDRDAVRSLVLSGEQSRRFDDPSRPHLYTEDRDMALDVDSAPFAVAVGMEHGLLVARPVYP